MISVLYNTFFMVLFTLSYIKKWQKLSNVLKAFPPLHFALFLNTPIYHVLYPMFTLYCKLDCTLYWKSHCTQMSKWLDTSFRKTMLPSSSMMSC